MSWQEIERSAWPRLFESFSRQHEGWLVILETLESDCGVREIAHGVTFDCLDYDLKGSDKDSLTVNLAVTRSTHLACTVAAPIRVRLQTTVEGAHEVLEIVSADGTTTCVRFRVAVLPETVDDVLMKGGESHGQR
jgi:Family of unknown function (DUF5335)